MKENPIFDYLTELRASGITTFIGATRHLEERFNIPHNEARKLIDEWNREHSFTK